MFAPPSKHITRRVTFLFFTLFIAISTISKAQRHTPGVNGDGDMIGGSSHNSGGYIMQDGWAFALSGGYESPQGDLKEVYKSAPVFGASVRRRMGNLVYSGTLAYRAYQPKQSSFPLTEDGIDYLSATYSKYTGVGTYAGIAYELPVGGLLSIYGGANGGVVFTKFSLTAGDGTSTYLSQSASDKVTYLGAKAGLIVTYQIILALALRHIIHLVLLVLITTQERAALLLRDLIPLQAMHF